VIFGAWALALTFAIQNAPTTPAADQAIWTDDRPFERLIPNLGHDAKSLASWDSLAILAVGAGGTLALHKADDNVALWMRDQEPSSYSKIGRHLGSGWVQGVAAIGTYAIGKLTHEPEATHIGSDLIRAQVMNGIITVGLKTTVGRRRPSGGPHSFPSGHTSATFASAAVLQGHYGWKVGVPAYAISGFIGWARFRDNSHWVTDVVAGSAIGLVVGRSVVAGHRPRSWSVVPVATKGGGALFFIKR
jgi:membrane-associated phospholipid phosphatase